LAAATRHGTTAVVFRALSAAAGPLCHVARGVPEFACRLAAEGQSAAPARILRRTWSKMRRIARLPAGANGGTDGGGSGSSKTANSGNKSSGVRGPSGVAIAAPADAVSAAGTRSGSRQRGHSTSVPIFFRPTFRRLRQLWQRKTTGICASGGRKRHGSAIQASRIAPTRPVAVANPDDGAPKVRPTTTGRFSGQS